jgi:UDP-galactopyranose mutase
VGIDTHLAELVVYCNNEDMMFANLEGRIAYYPLDFRPEVVGTAAVGEVAVIVAQHNGW